MPRKRRSGPLGAPRGGEQGAPGPPFPWTDASLHRASSICQDEGLGPLDPPGIREVSLVYYDGETGCFWPRNLHLLRCQPVTPGASGRKGPGCPRSDLAGAHIGEHGEKPAGLWLGCLGRQGYGGGSHHRDGCGTGGDPRGCCAGHVLPWKRLVRLAGPGWAERCCHWKEGAAGVREVGGWGAEDPGPRAGPAFLKDHWTWSQRPKQLPAKCPGTWANSFIPGIPEVSLEPPPSPAGWGACILPTSSHPMARPPLPSLSCSLEGARKGIGFRGLGI